MIIVGGHNVYPVEIENALREIFEDIEDVYVVGVPHEKLQEVPAAIIKMKPNTILSLAQIKEKCAALMEWTKIPQYVKFVEDFSAGMTVTGKIQKHKFREILVKELGLEHLTKIKTA